MESMFSNDKSLISLDLSNFNITSTKKLSNLLSGSKSLVFVNLNSWEENPDAGITSMITSVNKNLIYCINEEKSKEINKLLQKFSKNNDCDNICFSETRKIIIDKKICVDDCTKDDTYIYEYNNICYSQEQSGNEDDESYETEDTEKTQKVENTENVVNTETEEKESSTIEESTEKGERTQIEETESSNINKNSEKIESTEIEKSSEISKIQKKLKILRTLTKIPKKQKKLTIQLKNI